MQVLIKACIATWEIVALVAVINTFLGIALLNPTCSKKMALLLPASLAVLYRQKVKQILKLGVFAKLRLT